MLVWFQKKSLEMVAFRGVKSPKWKCDQKCSEGGAQRLRNFVLKKLFFGYSLQWSNSQHSIFENQMSIYAQRQHKRRFKVLQKGVCLILGYLHWIAEQKTTFSNKHTLLVWSQFQMGKEKTLLYVIEIAISSPVLKLVWFSSTLALGNRHWFFFVF